MNQESFQISKKEYMVLFMEQTAKFAASLIQTDSDYDSELIIKNSIKLTNQLFNQLNISYF